MWEYKVFAFTNNYVDDESLKKMNELGAEGWELVGVSEFTGGSRFCFFKRAK